MKRATLWRTLALFTAVTVLAGCREYRAIVAIDPDGSGTRTVTFDPEIDLILTDEQLPDVFALSEDTGWRSEQDEKGDVRYSRFASSATAEGWADLGDDIRVFGHGDGEPTVSLFNSISLETGRTDEGRTYTYRERFQWTGLKRDLTNVMSRIYEARLRGLQPRLPEVVIGELRGLFKACVSQTWERVGLSDDTESFTEALILDMTPDVIELIARHELDIAADDLTRLAEAVIEDEDKELEAVLDRDMFGVACAIFTSLHLTVALPGEIIDTNGTIDEDGDAYWQIGLLDPVDGPIEFYVRSLVRD